MLQKNILTTSLTISYYTYYNNFDDLIKLFLVSLDTFNKFLDTLTKSFSPCRYNNTLQ